MPFLCALIGIIVVVFILFSINLSFIIDYSDKTVVTLKYLFLKFTLVDTSKPKKEKKKKKKKKDEEAPPEEEASEDEGKKKGKPKGNSLIKQLYLDQGYDGIERMLRALGKSLGSFFGSLYKNLVVDELYITMITAGGDAADTAIKHGKLCSWLFPVLGQFVSTCKVKKYDFDISPDFLATKSEAYVYAKLHFTPFVVLYAVLALVVRLVFKVLIKVVFSKQKSDKSVKSAAKELLKNSEAEVNNTKNKRNINKDGASK
jgi:hypothetical protein